MKRQIPPDELREARREAFLMAGIALLGHPGGPRVTTRAVCRESRLTQRYFYESFDDYDSFIVATYRRARKIVRTNIARKVAGRTGMREIIEASIAGWTEVIVAQPEVVRSILQAPETEIALKNLAERQRADIEGMIAQELSHIADPLERGIVARSVWGAVRTLFMDYLNFEILCSPAELNLQCAVLVVHMILSAGEHSD